MFSDLQQFLLLFLHLDRYLGLIIGTYPLAAYGLVGMLVFMEPGFFMPFLPGDTVIFMSAALAASQSFSYPLLWVVVACCALLGDSLNYWIGSLLGHYLTRKPNRRFIKDSDLQRTHDFYAHFGGKAILFCRYVPVVRSLAPFMGGVGAMPFRQYLRYDVPGVLLWSGLYMNLGFFFGTLPWVQTHLAHVIPLVMAGTLIPTALVAFLTGRHIKAKKARSRLETTGNVLNHVSLSLPPAACPDKPI